LAIYHCSVKIISRSQGRSSTGAAAYRSAEKIVDERTDITHDYRRKSGVDHSVIMAPKNAPSWIKDRSQLWNTIEQVEKRKDSQLCREVEVAIPKELSSQEMRLLVSGYVEEQFVKKGMVADINFHHLDGENPHAHILLTMREITPEGFGKKNRSWNQKERLQDWRKSWEQHANQSLERSGHHQRIDHRTLEAQGIDRIPQVHIGAKVSEMESRGQRTERGARVIEICKANEKIIELEKYREALKYERSIEVEECSERRRPGKRDRTVSPSNSDLNGRTDKGQPGAEKSESRTSSGVERTAEPNLKSDERSRPGYPQSRSPAGERDTDRTALSEEHELEGLLSDALRQREYSDGAYERIIALARPQNRDRQGSHLVSDQTKRLDRTYLAARRQLKAFNCDAFEVGIRSSNGRMMIRQWSEKEVLNSVPWLKRENAKGADIFIRPAGEQNQGIILMDDLDRSKLTRMKESGLEPAIVTETSPNNYQAWVRVSDQPLTPRMATIISKSAAIHFEADKNSADWRHFGRLAGFTNRKPEHVSPDGRNPWVLCHTSNGQKASKSKAIVEHASKIIRQVDAENEKRKRLRTALEAPDGFFRYDPIRNYQKQFRALRERYGRDMDLSRADLMICKSMAKQGFSQKQLLDTLEQASPELSIRKAAHEMDYCKRTVKTAFQDPEVQLQIEQKLSQKRSRGLSR